VTGLRGFLGWSVCSEFLFFVSCLVWPLSDMLSVDVAFFESLVGRVCVPVFARTLFIIRLCMASWVWVAQVLFFFVVMLCF
jgi:hypothetical protein